jgi:hypothetical protein
MQRERKISDLLKKLRSSQQALTYVATQRTGSLEENVHGLPMTSFKTTNWKA